MEAYALTDVGQKRSMNQDSVYACTKSIGSLENLFIVADGMGGHQAGDFASNFVVENLVRFFETPYPERDVHGILKEGIRKVNRDLYECTSRDPKLNGAGSTLVLATIKGSVLYVANIGDSRLYLLWEALEQITKDHSYVEELVAMGKLKRGSRDYLEKKNIITRALGAERTVDIDFFDLKLEPDSTILMCSDGLSNMVEDSKLEEIILDQTEELPKKGEKLLKEANQNGGKDNIAVILVEPFTNEVEKC